MEGELASCANSCATIATPKPVPRSLLCAGAAISTWSCGPKRM